MAFKTFDVPEIGAVYIYKRRGVKNIRLSVDHDGKVKIIMPIWTPYRAALGFVTQRQTWIAHHKSQRSNVLENGRRVGKYHTLRIEPARASKIRTRNSSNEILVYHPNEMTVGDTEVQAAATQASLKALRQEAEQLLPQRLSELANKFGFEYNSLSVRNLKSRWGSCDTHKHITLNFFLMLLPWRLIDYVLIHELSHTRHLNHSSEFWEEVVRCLPDGKDRRKELKQHQPSLFSGSDA